MKKLVKLVQVIVLLFLISTVLVGIILTIIYILTLNTRRYINNQACTELQNTTEADRIALQGKLEAFSQDPTEKINLHLTTKELSMIVNNFSATPKQCLLISTDSSTVNTLHLFQPGLIPLRVDLASVASYPFINITRIEASGIALPQVWLKQAQSAWIQGFNDYFSDISIAREIIAVEIKTDQLVITTTLK